MSDIIEEQEAFNDVKEWIDERAHGALKKGGRGALQVLASGFGKGILVAAAALTVAIVGGMLIDPTMLGFMGSVADPIMTGLTEAGNFLLGSGTGIGLLFAGGAIGSMVAAHNENARISADAARNQAELLQKLRDKGAAVSPSQTQRPSQQKEQEHESCQGGHCARLMQQSHASPQQAAGQVR